MKIILITNSRSATFEVIIGNDGLFLTTSSIEAESLERSSEVRALFTSKLDYSPYLVADRDESKAELDKP